MEDISKYIKMMGKIALLSPKEEKRLLIKAKDGDNKARKKLIDSNLRLVIKIAKHYTDTGISFEDLIQQGNLGLMKAVDDFDFSKGERLSTFATIWINNKICETFRNRGGILLPDRLSKELRKYNKVKERLRQIKEREPTGEEIAEKMNITRVKVTILREVSKYKPSTLEEHQRQISTKRSGNKQAVFKKMLSGMGITGDILKQERISELLEPLSEKEKKLFNLKYENKEGENLSLRQIAKKLGISHEGVRKIDERIFKKLRDYIKTKEKEKFG